MKRILLISFFILGFTSIVAQAVILREITVSFHGNEFFMSATLSFWLFWVGIGSLLLPKLFTKRNINLLIFCHLVIFIILPLEILALRASRSFIVSPGEIPNLILSLAYTFFIIAPLGLVLGLEFALAARLYSYQKNQKIKSKFINRGYIIESLGFVSGGIIFNFFLITFSEFVVIFILAALNILCVYLLLILTKSQILLKVLTVSLLGITFAILFSAKSLDWYSLQYRFPNQKLILSKNSLYGNIAVTKIGEQYNYWESGLLLGTQEEGLLNETVIHFPLLSSSQNKDILLVGGGLTGALGEVLKYNSSCVYYLELDPNLIKSTFPYLSLKTKNALQDRRIKIVNQDARFFIKNTNLHFDLIILNLPNPSTALLNRYYTQEFFKEAGDKLRPEGILSLHLESSPNYLNQETKKLISSISKTLEQNFAYQTILAEDRVYLSASNSPLPQSAQVLVEKYNRENIQNKFVTPKFISYMFLNDRRQMVQGIIKTTDAYLNYDFKPIAHYYEITYWVSKFQPILASLLGKLTKPYLWYTLTGVIIFLLIILRRKQKSPSLMFIQGFTWMGLEIILILSFQFIYGFVFEKIALVISLFMFGLAQGAFLLNYLGQKRKPYSLLIKIQIAALIYFLLLASAFKMITKFSLSPTIINTIFWVLVILAGFLDGAYFPLLNKIFLQKTKRKLARLGTIYAADILGSAIGAFLPSVFLIPILGIYQTLLIFGLINVSILLVLLINQGSIRN